MRGGLEARQVSVQSRGVCAAAEEQKPVSYKLKKGELDAPDPTPQRSEGEGDEASDEESAEEQNGKQAASESSSEAEQDDEGPSGTAAQKEQDMQVQELPHPCAAACPLCVLTAKGVGFTG